ncbi:FHA domain-containing protein [Peredibacter sp. HCB2-198]|uniref:FHA domain-containing protein n=1 Tax=Peredibacter sp. HCB2-198 TaxID=3383025 RepID=UPI0038B560E2
MRIEVTVGSNEPTIYPLSLPKITVGSSDGCEIVINGNGISRKHITIVTENDSYFIVDQGSTNGSFINEERLVPGKKTEFTSFFPVRLGDDVVISLLSDEEKLDKVLVPLREKSSEGSRPDISRSDMTSTAISRKMLRQDKTGTHTNIKIPKSISKTKSETLGIVAKAKQINVIPIAAFGILAFAVYWNLFVIEKAPSEITEAPIEEYKIAKSLPTEPAVSHHVPKDELLPKEGFTKYQSDIKCVSDVELYFCNLIPGLKVAPYGAVQSKLNVYLMLDGSPYFEEAKRVTDPYAPITPPNGPGGQPAGSSVQVNSHEKEQFSEAQYNMGIYLFLMKYLPQLDEVKTQDLNILVAFYSKSSPHHPIKVIAFTGKGFNKVKPMLKEDQLIQIRGGGDSAMAPLKEAIEIY